MAPQQPGQPSSTNNSNDSHNLVGLQQASAPLRNHTRHTSHDLRSQPSQGTSSTIGIRHPCKFFQDQAESGYRLNGVKPGTTPERIIPGPDQPLDQEWHHTATWTTPRLQTQINLNAFQHPGYPIQVKLHHWNTPGIVTGPTQTISGTFPPGGTDHWYFPDPQVDQYRLRKQRNWEPPGSTHRDQTTKTGSPGQHQALSGAPEGRPSRVAAKQLAKIQPDLPKILSIASSSTPAPNAPGGSFTYRKPGQPLGPGGLLHSNQDKLNGSGSPQQTRSTNGSQRSLHSNHRTNFNGSGGFHSNQDSQRVQGALHSNQDNQWVREALHSNQDNHRVREAPQQPGKPMGPGGPGQHQDSHWVPGSPQPIGPGGSQSGRLSTATGPEALHNNQDNQWVQEVLHSQWVREALHSQLVRGSPLQPGTTSLGGFSTATRQLGPGSLHNNQDNHSMVQERSTSTTWTTLRSSGQTTQMIPQPGGHHHTNLTTSGTTPRHSHGPDHKPSLKSLLPPGGGSTPGTPRTRRKATVQSNQPNLAPHQARILVLTNRFKDNITYHPCGRTRKSLPQQPGQPLGPGNAPTTWTNHRSRTNNSNDSTTSWFSNSKTCTSGNYTRHSHGTDHKPSQVLLPPREDRHPVPFQTRRKASTGRTSQTWHHTRRNYWTRKVFTTNSGQPLGPGNAPQQPGQPIGPGQTTQMIPQPGGLPIIVKPAPPGTTPGIVTGPDHKPSQVLLPPGGGSTPGTLPGPGGKPVQVEPAKPGTTPGAITGPDQQLSKIILPTTPAGSGKAPQQPMGPSNAPLQPGQPMGPGVSPQQPRQPLGPGGSPQQPGQPLGPGGSPTANRSGRLHKPSRTWSGGSPQQPGQPMGPGGSPQPMGPGGSPQPMGPGGSPQRHRVQEALQQQPGQPMGPGGSPQQPGQPMGPGGSGQPMGPGGSPQLIGPGGSPQQPGQPMGPGGSVYNPQNPSNNGLGFPGLPNNQNLFQYLPNFENIFRQAVNNGNTRIPNLIQGVLQAKGQSPDTLDLREFIRNLSAVFGVMRYENPNLTYVELYIELMMETLIGTLEVIRASDPSCLVQPPTVDGIPKYVNAFYDILI
ncbi:hypothetical protein AVEN_40621-1 [Araneus ventricosus]|uniref:Uncharacterized protein n=1 Tax=Araneus ventricosus TaxID=182803 RepID=A0A4Y2JAD9_ARAVE|nr:hypothetical protein AVEN_40621-1 [Araneus ventricosus]